MVEKFLISPSQFPMKGLKNNYLKLDLPDWYIPANICWSSRRLEDVFKTCFRNVFVTIFRLPRRLGDVLKTSCEDVLKTSRRRLEDVMEDEKLLR